VHQLKPLSGLSETVLKTTGGRSSISGITATVFGSSGFVSRYVCNRLGML
jgi:NADH dehydrogenase (ubiquinone) 1 alpha subcomplex subunit 9